MLTAHFFRGRSNQPLLLVPGKAEKGLVDFDFAVAFDEAELPEQLNSLACVAARSIPRDFRGCGF